MSKDELTDLLKRADYLEQLQNALALASQHNQHLILLQVDCDRLLHINNTYGHVVGDAFIRSVGAALERAFSADSIVARTGGDEFAAVISNQPVEAVLARVEAMLAAIGEQPLEFENKGQPTLIPIHASAGLVFLPAGDANASIDELSRKAYEALLTAKEAGGGVARVYSEAEERDALTATLKRYGLFAQFDHARQLADQAHNCMAVIDFDVDEFDSINKQFGRYTGDVVLRRVATALTNNFKEIGSVGRYSGDQFVVILPDNRAENAFILAEEVRRAIEDTPVEVHVGSQKTHLTIHISGGVAEYPTDGADWQSLFRKADEALYRAKRQGRNRICLPVSSQMVTKTSHFTQVQLEKLSELAKKSGKTEAHLLREALDDLLNKYEPV
jgi:diguanylate cyclase